MANELNEYDLYKMTHMLHDFNAIMREIIKQKLLDPFLGSYSQAMLYVADANRGAYHDSAKWWFVFNAFRLKCIESGAVRNCQVVDQYLNDEACLNVESFIAQNFPKVETKITR